MFIIEPAATNLLIEDLTFDGNRSGQGLAYTPSNSVYRHDTCSNVAVDSYAGMFHDIVVSASTSMDSYPSNCWNCIKFDGITVKDSPGYGLQVSRSGVRVTYSEFTDGFLSGILTWIDVGSGHEPVNHLEVYWSDFIHWGGSGIAVNNAGSGTFSGGQYDGPKLGALTFEGNHREFPHRTKCGSPCPGGQLMLAHPTLYSVVYDSTFDGELVNGSIISQPSLKTTGLELYGTGHDIARNWFHHHDWMGVSLTGARYVTVREGWMDDNTGSGIEISSDVDQSEPCSDEVLLDDNDITYNGGYGLAIYWNPVDGDEMYDVDYSNNNISNNNGGGSQIYVQNTPGTGSCM